MRSAIALAATAAALCVALATGGGDPRAATPPVPGAPSPGGASQDGPSGRYLLATGWELRRDPQDAGLAAGWQNDTGAADWTAVAMPNAWNAGDDSNASMKGGVAWYRVSFALPDGGGGLTWAARFGSVSSRARVWLNGREVGRHTGAFLPFDVILAGAARGGANRLVVRVDNRRTLSDFPPYAETPDGTPAGGWWNYGGILREVELRRIDGVDVPTVTALPVAVSRARARLLVRATVAGYTRRPVRIAVRARFAGRTATLGTVRVGGGRRAIVSRTLSIRRPRLWAPGSPSLYSLRVTAVGRGAAAANSVHVGIRRIEVKGGRLRINGRAIDVRGVGLHEDSRDRGFALTPAQRSALFDRARELGAGIIRAHYPLAPQLHELADRAGVLIWEEIPVYSVRSAVLAKGAVRRRAVRLLSDDIAANASHPSVLLWSIGNELSTKPGRGQQRYIEAAVRRAHALDPTRPVALALAGSPEVGCRTQYADLDVLGLNEYFGWYAGRGGTIADRDQLSAWLDTMRRCYRDKALLVSEFGAEANRDGPVEERGTYAFQRDFVRFHLGVFARKPWLSGAIYWALSEFRVRPGWDGGNPRPQPPLHQKGLVTFDGAPKPAFADVQASFRHTRQIGP